MLKLLELKHLSLLLKLLLAHFLLLLLLLLLIRLLQDVVVHVHHDFLGGVLSASLTIIGTIGSTRIMISGVT